MLYRRVCEMGARSLLREPAHHVLLDAALVHAATDFEVAAITPVRVPTVRYMPRKNRVWGGLLKCMRSSCTAEPVLSAVLHTPAQHPHSVTTYKNCHI